MSFDFPNTPTIGTLFDTGTGVVYAWDGAAWVVSSVTRLTARRGNRVVNGNMAISQENGNTAGTANPYYGADQFFTQWSSPGVYTTQSVNAVTPNGSIFRYRVTVTTADAALAAGSYLLITTRLETTQVADFMYGSASAKQSVLLFGFKGPAGTYSIHLMNGNTANRSYVGQFTISAGQANTDTVQTFVIPGDTTGTWFGSLNGSGLQLDIVLATGSTFKGATGWQAGNIFGTAANTNGMATVGNVFELFDVGLWIDPDNTGLPPPWEVPDYATELVKCMRYWESGSFIYYAYQSAGSGFGTTQSFNVSKRTTAAMSITGQSITNATNGTLTAQGTNAFMSNAQASATGTCTHTGTYTANARM
jgi:hypothetical protein